VGGGIHQDVYRNSHGHASTSTYAFYGWPPTPIVLFGITFSPGDSVRCSVRVDDDNTTAHFHVTNQTTKATTTVAFNSPDGYSLAGNEAEWMVSVPSGDQCANFGSVTFSGCCAKERNYDSDGNRVDDIVLNLSNLDYLLEMVEVEADGTREVLCTPKIVNDTTLKITYDG
jgi:hypothetical protein